MIIQMILPEKTCVNAWNLKKMSYSIKINPNNYTFNKRKASALTPAVGLFSVQVSRYPSSFELLLFLGFQDLFPLLVEFFDEILDLWNSTLVDEIAIVGLTFSDVSIDRRKHQFFQLL